MENKNATNPLAIILGAFAAIQGAYPISAISLKFPLNSALEQTHLWDAPDGKLYLWATAHADHVLELFSTDTDEIDDAGICTRELTTPQGLTIIIAEDF